MYYPGHALIPAANSHKTWYLTVHPISTKRSKASISLLPQSHFWRRISQFWLNMMQDPKRIKYRPCRPSCDRRLSPNLQHLRMAEEWERRDLMVVLGKYEQITIYLIWRINGNRPGDSGKWSAGVFSGANLKCGFFFLPVAAISPSHYREDLDIA